MEICGPVSEVEVPGFLVNPGIRQIHGICHGKPCQRLEQDHSRIADQHHVTGTKAGGGHRHSVEEIRAPVHDTTGDGQVPAGSNRSSITGSSYPDEEFANYGIDQVCGGPVAVQPGSQDNRRKRGYGCLRKGHAGKLPGEFGHRYSGLGGEQLRQRRALAAPVEAAYGGSEAAQAKIERTALITAQILATTDANQGRRPVRSEEC